MIGVVVVSAVLLGAAAVLVLVRAERGPTMLDRTVALDLLTSVVLGAVALHAAWTRSADGVGVLVALALVGFVSSVTIARFASVEPEGEGRVLTPAEAAALEAQRRAEEESTDDGEASDEGLARGHT